MLGGPTLALARHELRVPVVERPRARRHRSRPEAVSEFRRRPAQGVRGRDAIVPRQHPARRQAQRARVARREVHVRERAARASLRHFRHPRRSVPPRRARRSAPLRPVRQGQRAARHVVPGPHVAGAARRVDHGARARHAAASAAAGRVDESGAARHRAAAFRPRAAPAAPDLELVQRVPRRDRPARPGARELQRRRRMAHVRARQRRGDRSDGQARERQARQQPDRSARSAAGRTGPVRADRRAESHDVCARPPRGVLRHAGPARDRARLRSRPLFVRGHRQRRGQQRAVPYAHGARDRQRAAPRPWLRPRAPILEERTRCSSRRNTCRGVRSCEREASP